MRVTTLLASTIITSPAPASPGGRNTRATRSGDVALTVLISIDDGRSGSVSCVTSTWGVVWVAASSASPEVWT